MTTLTTTYSFMDLLKDKGHVPSLEETSIMLEIENGFNTIAQFMEDNTVDYDFLDLLRDKAYNLSTVPVAVNDNERLLLQA